MKKLLSADLRWHFPDCDHGESDGLNDPMLQYFEGNYERYIARETIQNSIDARIEEGNPPPVVAMEFEYIEIPTKAIPGINELKERMKACLERSKNNKEDKSIAFFSRALRIINETSIPVLKISDFNTKGLEGLDEEEKGSWYKLVKAIGENCMTGAGGGSYGIGKGAPIAASLIHTVYYSTLNRNNEYVFQGRARLTTHTHEGKKKRGSGFWGIYGYQSIRSKEKESIPEGFRRTEQGTDIYVIAYKPENTDWKTEIIKSVLDNFWMAVKTKDLVVNFKDENGNLLLDADSLESMLLQYSPNDTYQYFLSVVKPTRSENKQLPTLGSCELYIRQDPALIDKKDVILMRLPKMSVKKRPFRIMNDGFVGVMLCNDIEGNKLLRDMEPPKHDEWNFELAPDKTKAKRALNELYDWIKDILRQMADTSSSDPEEIPGLDQFLPLEDDGSGMAYDDTSMWNGSQPEESPKEVNAVEEETPSEVEDVVQRFNAVKRTAGAGLDEGSKINGKGISETHRPNGSEGGTNPGNIITKINTNNIKFRTIALRDKMGNLEYCLILNPFIDQQGAINIVAVGDDSNYPVQINCAGNWDSDEIYEIKGSMIKNLKLEKGQIKKIRFRLNNNKIRYALGIENYEG